MAGYGNPHGGGGSKHYSGGGGYTGPPSQKAEKLKPATRAQNIKGSKAPSGAGSQKSSGPVVFS